MNLNDLSKLSLEELKNLSGIWYSRACSGLCSFLTYDAIEREIHYRIP